MESMYEFWLIKAENLGVGAERMNCEMIYRKFSFLGLRKL
jgi:hypothetical protein